MRWKAEDLFVFRDSDSIEASIELSMPLQKDKRSCQGHCDRNTLKYNDTDNPRAYCRFFESFANLQLPEKL
jgi:hypothetical protein